jgi:hypothetical protein
MSHWFDRLATRAAASADVRQDPPAGPASTSPEIVAPSRAPGAYTRRRGLQLTLLAVAGTTVGPLRSLLWPTQARADAYGGCNDSYGACKSKAFDNFSSQMQGCSRYAFGDLEDSYYIIGWNMCITLAGQNLQTGLTNCDYAVFECIDDVDGGGNGSGGNGQPGTGTEDCTTLCGGDLGCECQLCGGGAGGGGGTWCSCYCNYSNYPCDPYAC